MQNGKQRGRRIRPGEIAQAQRFKRPPEPVEPDDQEPLSMLEQQIADTELDAAGGQERW